MIEWLGRLGEWLIGPMPAQYMSFDYIKFTLVVGALVLLALSIILGLLSLILALRARWR